MFPSTVRWRLPLSYASIALLTALTLSGLLLSLLSGYYVRQEKSYLTGNARAMGTVMARMLEQDLPQQWFESQMSSFAILSQSRARLLDADQQVVADSGSLEDKNGVFLFNWDLSSVPVRLVLGAHTRSGPLPGASDGHPTPVLPANKVIVGPSGVVTSTTPSQTQPATTSYMYAASAVGTPFGFGLSPDAVAGGGRSNQVVQEPILDRDEQLVGYIELSEGPAYGRQILESVAIGSAVAGGVAILAAAGVGWWMSRHITSPLRDLAAVTARMAGGDLSARANLSRRDEFGVLSKSFDLMADRVETTVGALRRFVADAAHEMQTPLTALRTNLELAPEDTFVRQAQSQARRIWVLVQNLLDLSRLEAGEPMKGKASIDVVQLMQELGEQYASRAQQAGLAYDMTIPARPVVIRGNKAQILQALSNLLDNAIKFSDEGGHIRVGVSQETTQVELWVEDTGIGIPEEDFPHIADRFHRGRNASPYPGNGLGLAIVKAVADNHGGTITVKSAVDKGTRCSLCFPMGL